MKEQSWFALLHIIHITMLILKPDIVHDIMMFWGLRELTLTSAQHLINMNTWNQNNVVKLSTHSQRSLDVGKTELLTVMLEHFLDRDKRKHWRWMLLLVENSCEHKQVRLYSPAAAVHNTPKLQVRINTFPCQACEI